ncbi:hypothetical protein BGZ81_006175 [Podila clonocystis]|nr:hypothetical protein BGZ81_006175 [Podila clonocystis]
MPQFQLLTQIVFVPVQALILVQVGPLDHSLRKLHYSTGKGYQESANAVIARPDHVPVQLHMAQVPVQPQVMIPMQPLPYLFVLKVIRVPASGKMFDNRHANLWRIRLLLILFTLVVGALFAAFLDLDVVVITFGLPRTSSNSKGIASVAIPFISFVTYVYAVWGATRVPTKVRSFLVFGLAYGLLFCCLSVLFLIKEESYPQEATKLGCNPGEDACQILRTAQVLGSITGCMMILEVIMTARIGPLDHSLRKHQYKATGGNGGYQPSANVVIVRPDYVPFQPAYQVQVPVQPQVLVPMPLPQQQPYSYQTQSSHPQHPQHEVIQHDPLPQAPQSTPTSH